jgi:exopolyphosphatase/pppGpp-phosphohydrolase
MLNISAIDVGSNAMRMVIGEVDENWRVNTIGLTISIGRNIISTYSFHVELEMG